MTEIYMNSKFIGTCDNAKDFAKQFIEDRRKGTIPLNANIYHDEETDEIFIENMRGRVRRPLIVVKSAKPLLTERHLLQLEKNEISWNDLVKQGIIEYLDVAEEENCIIAFTENEITEETTHLEVAPLVMFGLTSSLVPYLNYGPSARGSIGSKNQKQGIGFYAANFPIRMDMDINLLHTPQMPVVKTINHNVLNYDKHPSGQNIIVAIMSFNGYNLEDAVIVNKGSIERGMGRSTYYRITSATELRYAGGLTDDICIPDKEVKGYKSEKDYRFLEADGIIYPESKVREGDVIIGKTSPPRFLSSLDEYNLASNLRRESSLAIPHGEDGIIDFVAITENEEGNRMVQVRLRDQRIPEIGDKFTSRYGQKGVIGMIVPESSMPFTASGIRPDLIFSPHGIPSRMTVSHLIELVGGKMGALSGRYVNGTSFEAESEESLRKELLSMGFREDGTEVMYNGETGEKMTARIYVGNMYYLRLKHMVANKIHSRARGPIQLLTRQPTEGRAKEGGLRLGEMEKDTFVAAGFAHRDDCLVRIKSFLQDQRCTMCNKCVLLHFSQS
jgi:DNA-directed RNA polymerase subunit B'